MPLDLIISFFAGILITGVGGFWFLDKTCDRNSPGSRWPFKIPRGQKRIEIWAFLILLFLFNVGFTTFAYTYINLLLPAASLVISIFLTILSVITLNVLFLFLGYRGIEEPW
jgi:hypothetical protein